MYRFNGIICESFESLKEHMRAYFDANEHPDLFQVFNDAFRIYPSAFSFGS